MMDDIVQTSPFRKSRRSFANGNCVETAGWRKSAYCQTGECVEVASGILVRDSKNSGMGPVLQFTADAWKDFTRSLAV